MLLNKELDADDAEMTRTRKVRRGFVAEKYAPVIAALYDGGEETQLTMDITFEDGRKSQLTSTLLVHDVAASRPRPAGGVSRAMLMRTASSPLAPTVIPAGARERAGPGARAETSPSVFGCRIFAAAHCPNTGAQSQGIPHVG